MSSQDRVAVVVNANARAFAGRRPPRASTGSPGFDELLRLGRGRARFFVTHSRRELAEALRDAHARSAAIVVFCGGDGTYGAGITAARLAWGSTPLPVFGFGPGGTVGTVPHALGLEVGGDLLGKFTRVLHEACSLRPAVLASPTLEVQLERPAIRGVDAVGSPAPAERASVTERATTSRTERTAFVVGAGLVSSFFSLYDPVVDDVTAEPAEFRPSRGRGRLAAALITGRVFVESFVGGPLAKSVLSPIPCEIEIDGHRLPWSASSLVLASVLRDVGLGLRVTYRAGEDVRRPHVVVSGLPPKRLGPRLPRVLRGVSIGEPTEALHHDGLASELVLRYGREGGLVVVDGDVEHVAMARVTAGPVLRLLAPSRG